jgi:hypothetical protein
VKKTQTIGSRDLDVATIGHGPGGPRVMLIFLRVDSTASVNNDPTQQNIPPPVSLGQLFTSGDPTLQIGSVFVQDGYTKQQLIDQLVDIIKFVRPGILRTQDTADGLVVDYPNAETRTDHGCDGGSNFYDHTDHVWGARFAREALGAYNNLPGNRNQPTYVTYRGYNLEWGEDVGRVSTKDFCLKKSIFFQYALDDGSATDITAPAQQAGFDCYSYDYIGYQQSATPAP